MRLKLVRKYPLKDYCIGKLYIDGEYFCDTLEDTVRDLNHNGVFDNGEYKIPDKTAIPYGLYEIHLAYSPKFGRILPRLLDVPHFSGILIHRGNTPDHTSGCILVGENKVKGQVINSTKYEVELLLRMNIAKSKGEVILIDIVTA